VTDAKHGTTAANGTVPIRDVSRNNAAKIIIVTDAGNAQMYIPAKRVGGN